MRHNSKFIQRSMASLEWLRTDDRITLELTASRTLKILLNSEDMNISFPNVSAVCDNHIFHRINMFTKFPCAGCLCRCGTTRSVHGGSGHIGARTHITATSMQPSSARLSGARTGSAEESRFDAGVHRIRIAVVRVRRRLRQERSADRGQAFSCPCKVV